MEEARTVITHERENLMRNPKPDSLLMDWIHMAAFRDNTIGLPRLTPNDSVDHITRQMLFSFMKTYFVPERMVVVGIGVDHEQMVATTEKYLCSQVPTWDSDADTAASLLEHGETSLLLPSIPPLDDSKAVYTGGEFRLSRDLSRQALGPSPYPELAHLVLGLESCSYLDEENFVASCVLNTLLGGGGSFSAGGPGKGMYSLLYTDLLNRYHWLHNAVSYNHVYADSGFLCIHAAGPPKQMLNMVKLLVHEYVSLTSEIEEEALERAKTQLTANMLMNLELRPVIFEDVGRQIIGQGERKSPMETIEKIRQIGRADINRVAERMLASKPAVVGYGTLDKLPDWAKIDAALAHRDISKLDASRFFSLSK